MNKKSQVRVIGILLFVVLLSVIALSFSITEQDNKTIVQTENSSLDINLSSYFPADSQYELNIFGDINVDLQGEILAVTGIAGNATINVAAYFDNQTAEKSFEIIYEESIEENLTSISNDGGGF